MFIVSVTVFVKPEFVDQFIAETLENARNTRLEPNNLRFDVSQAVEDPSRFLLYEVYHRPEDFQAHQQTQHYLKWKTAIADWMASPRLGVKHQSLFFGNVPV